MYSEIRVFIFLKNEFQLISDPKNATEQGYEKGKKNRRRSHLRLNETFDYVEDDEDPTQLNNTITPQGNSASLVDACHRKSSRQSKDRHSGGDGVESPCSETVRGQTPRSSRKARRSSTIHHSDFITDGEPEASSQDLDICSECLEKENMLLSARKADTEIEHAENCPANPHNHVRSKILTANNTCDASTMTLTLQRPKQSKKSNSSTPKQSKIPVSTTPTSVCRGHGSFTASTISSAIKSATQKSKIPSRKKSTRTIVEGLPSSSRSIKKNKGNGKSKNIGFVSPAQNFARQHARMFAKMETIGDMHERIARRHEEVMQAVPNVIKRLATPKSVHRDSARTRDTLTKKPGYMFDASKAKVSVTENSFRFGKVDDFPAAHKQGTSGTVVNSFTLKTAKPQDRRDVKSRTKDNSKQRTAKRLISVTVPTDKESINVLATPKGLTPSRPRGKVSYTPHRGVVTFIDTTKLSDREFELAVANGLIKGRSGRSSMRLEASRKASRDDILDVKRKLNIVQ
ncbi:hypothetical protein COOONC_21600 [Cooperia oncophora]